MIFFSEILSRQWSRCILATHLPSQLFTEQLPCFKTKNTQISSKEKDKKKKSYFNRIAIGYGSLSQDKENVIYFTAKSLKQTDASRLLSLTNGSPERNG